MERRLSLTPSSHARTRKKPASSSCTYSDLKTAKSSSSGTWGNPCPKTHPMRMECYDESKQVHYLEDRPPDLHLLNECFVALASFGPGIASISVKGASNGR